MTVLTKLLLALALVLPPTAVLAVVDGSSASSVEAPPPDTIVRIEGDAANGFGIYYADGSERFPPTDSEARAECGEYDTRVQRVRCRTQVRTWYRDLAATQQALDWAHADPSSAPDRPA